ncbi:MAG: GGDEF domain-containing protein [Pseudoxanthomonas sp.]|nr:GGDEF domain-containing protein [Pseudoxanthomonas sp.]
MRALVAAIVLLFCCGPLPAAEDFGRLLDRADAIRSGDRARFEAALAALREHPGPASQAQRERLDFLEAFAEARQGDFPAAIVRLRALSASSGDPAMRFRAGAFLVNTLAGTREFAEGLRVLDATLALADQVDDPEVRNGGLLAGAVLYNQVGQYVLGRELAHRVAASSREPRTLCVARTVGLEAELELSEVPLRSLPFEETIGLCRAQGELIVAGFASGYLARRYAAEGDPARAADVLRGVLDSVEATGYPRLVGEIHGLLASYSLATGDRAAAERHARRAVEQGAGISYAQPVVDAHHTLHELALARGDIGAALGHYRRYAQADKAFLDDVKARELAFQMVRHETLQKNQTIELLNQRNDVLELEQRLARQAAANSRLALVLLLVLLASIGFWAYKIKRLQMAFRRLAQVDGLTGIANRHHFTGQAAELLARAAREGMPATLLMFDLDLFKAINDRHGHAAGDWALRQVARSCARDLREGDLFGRLGGEEFAVLLPGLDAAAALAMAERLRAGIEEIDTTPAGARFPITASFGLAEGRGASADLDALLVRADRALYRAKRAGRNRVEVERSPTPDAGPGDIPGDSSLAVS